MLDTLDGTPYRLPFLLVVGTGMRRGEVLRLKWEDFKAETRTLIVARAIVQTRGAITVKLSKSGRTRVILLPINLIEELKQHKEAQKAKGYTGEWIVTTNAGDRMNPTSFANGVDLARKRAGVKAPLHSWRHDQATTLLMAGVPAKIVSERLGHSTINTTQDIYAHVLPTMQAPAVEILDAKWAKYYEEKTGLKIG
jgi:integrase